MSDDTIFLRTGLTTYTRAELDDLFPPGDDSIVRVLLDKYDRELAEAQSNAERYRWLRSRLMVEDIDDAARITPSDDEEETQISERIDGVIDAFLERKP